MLVLTEIDRTVCLSPDTRTNYMGSTKRWQKRGRWSGRRRSVKTGRLISAPEAPKLRLSGTLLLRRELLYDFLLYLDGDSLVALCSAMVQARNATNTFAVLFDKTWWQHLLQAHCHVHPAALNVHRSFVVIGGCDELADYVSLRSQQECFGRCVQVVKGDLGTITTIGDQQVDCLVFPTSCSYRNPFRGVAGRVHERAGPDLDQIVQNMRLRNNARAGSVMCTVGCGSGVRLLVHCVGPRSDQRNSEALLYKTYVHALLAADSNHVNCTAVASISTGLYRFPHSRAADIALSAVRDLIRLRPNWSVNIAFVCIDDDVYDNFHRAHQESAQAFHTTGLAFPHLVRELSMAEPRMRDTA